MQSWPLALNALAFLVAAVVIWRTGAKLEHLADRVSRRIGLGQAFTGMLLLAATTSLPEIATDRVRRRAWRRNRRAARGSNRRSGRFEQWTTIYVGGAAVVYRSARVAPATP
jgi:uncharacterized membrane protein YidH (DUF202 family)